jgi:hypothetical protein
MPFFLFMVLAVVFIGGFMLLIGIVIDIVEYNSGIKSLIEREHRSIKLKFSAFINFYNVNPNAWTVEDRICPIYTENKENWNAVNYIIYFNYFDFHRYQYWKKQKKNDEKEIKNIRVMTDFTQAVQKDVLKAKQDSQKRIDEMVSKIDEIKQRLEAEHKDAAIVAQLDKSKCVTRDPEKMAYIIEMDKYGRYHIVDSETHERLR